MVTITLRKDDPLLKEIAKLFEKAGRGSEFKKAIKDAAKEAKEDPPDIDPGG